MIFIACTLRLKFYFIWPLAECSLTLAGLNFKGWSEDGKEAEWGRCKNVDMYNVELQPSARVLPQYWNICTGVFLRRCVLLTLWDVLVAWPACAEAGVVPIASCRGCVITCRCCCMPVAG
jgi:hypothetical protein